MPVAALSTGTGFAAHRKEIMRRMRRKNTVCFFVRRNPLPEDTPKPLTEEPSPTEPTPQRSPAPENEAKPLQKDKTIIKRTLSTNSAAKTKHIDKKGKVERLPELGRAGPITRALRKAQQQELGTVEVKKEVEREAEHKVEHKSEHEATFEELKELLYEGGEAKREDSAAVESTSDGLKELDVDSLPSLQQIFHSQDLKKGSAMKEEE
jgi:hypothetical protein